MPTKGALVVIGGGGHAWVVTQSARAQGWHVMGFFDDDPAAEVDPTTPRLGGIPDAPQHSAEASDAANLPETIIAIGSLSVRARLIQELGGRFATVVHPSAVVCSSAKIGPGAFIGPGAIINGRAVIGPHCIINSGAIVEHDCTLEQNVHVAPRVALGGGVHVGADTLVGLGAAVRPQTRIGREVIVGVGAAVIRDVPDGAKVVGVPAKPVEWWTEGDSA